jgi:hypothetical protein
MAFYSAILALFAVSGNCIASISHATVLSTPNPTSHFVTFPFITLYPELPAIWYKCGATVTCQLATSGGSGGLNSGVFFSWAFDAAMTCWLCPILFPEAATQVTETAPAPIQMAKTK